MEKNIKNSQTKPVKNDLISPHLNTNSNLKSILSLRSLLKSNKPSAYFGVKTNNNSIHVILPSTLVISDILIDNDGNFRNYTIYQAMKQIYNKYICHEAEIYQINISGEMRAKFDDIFKSSDDEVSIVDNNEEMDGKMDDDNIDKDGKNGQELNNMSKREKYFLNMYDDAAVDILWTMHDASHRFQSTESFDSYRNNLRDDMMIMSHNNKDYHHCGNDLLL